MLKERPVLYAEYVAGSLCAVLLFIWWLIFSFVHYSSSSIFRFALITSFLFIIAFTTVVYQHLSTYKRTYKMAQKISKNLLAHSGELFYELYRNSPVPYILIDMHGTIESANTSAIRLFGVLEDALDGTNFFRYIEDDGTHKTQLIPEYFKQDKPIEGAEITLVKSDDMLRFAMLSIFSYKDVDGTKKGLVTLVDITKQKMVDKAKTEFVSLASHQLRTPISSMRWNVEIFQGLPGTELNDVQKQYIKKISDGLARMDSLISDFLSVSKLELGTLKPHYEAFDFTQFLSVLREEYKLHIEKKNISFETNWTDEFGTIISDTRLLGWRSETFYFYKVSLWVGDFPRLQTNTSV
jgi:PAS domain S-box-containing protein